MTFFFAHIKIYGRVQGVFFRQTTFNKANQQHLSGYVRNLSDGSVEAVFEGDESSVNMLLDWCKIGPSHAKVKGVDIISKGIIEQKKYESFVIC